MRALLDHSDAHNLGLTADHLIRGASEDEITEILRQRVSAQGPSAEMCGTGALSSQGDSPRATRKSAEGPGVAVDPSAEVTGVPVVRAGDHPSEDAA
ncbi:MAG: hypothetical protein AAFY65_01250 [Pseudomonadota bacterium]